MTGHSFDGCLDLVSDWRRRQIVQQLRDEADRTTTFESLVDQLRGDESPAPDHRLEDQERLAIQLEHTHLPKLADHDVVEYDRRSGTVRYQPDDQIEAMLDSFPEETPPPDP